MVVQLSVHVSVQYTTCQAKGNNSGNSGILTVEVLFHQQVCKNNFKSGLGFCKIANP